MNEPFDQRSSTGDASQPSQHQLQKYPLTYARLHRLFRFGALVDRDAVHALTIGALVSIIEREHTPRWQASTHMEIEQAFVSALVCVMPFGSVTYARELVHNVIHRIDMMDVVVLLRNEHMALKRAAAVNSVFD